MESTQEGVILHNLPKSHKKIFFSRTRFRVVKSTPSGSSSKVGADEYLDVLRFPSAAPEHQGTYYCFVTNSVGIDYKSAFLAVLPREAVREEEEGEEGEGKEEADSQELVVVVVICLAVAAFALLAVIVACLLVK